MAASDVVNLVSEFWSSEAPSVDNCENDVGGFMFEVDEATFETFAAGVASPLEVIIDDDVSAAADMGVSCRSLL